MTSEWQESRNGEAGLWRSLHNLQGGRRRGRAYISVVGVKISRCPNRLVGRCPVISLVKVAFTVGFDVHQGGSLEFTISVSLRGYCRELLFKDFFARIEEIVMFAWILYRTFI